MVFEEAHITLILWLVTLIFEGRNGQEINVGIDTIWPKETGLKDYIGSQAIQ